MNEKEIAICLLLAGIFGFIRPSCGWIMIAIWAAGYLAFGWLPIYGWSQ